MKKDLFVVGDVHGCYEQLVKLLSHWNKEKEQLVFLGDLIDRGENSLKVLQLAMKLQKENGAVVLGGNHEELFLAWLDSPVNGKEAYYFQGGINTLSSFGIDPLYYDPVMVACFIRRNYASVLQFLKELPDYYETENHIFAHAGINLQFENWRNTRSRDFKWIRSSFHYGKNETGKVVIFGHTPTCRLNEDGTDDVWFAPCQKKIGIDGGAAFGGMLHGLRITNDEDYEVFSVMEDLSVQHKVF